MSRKMDDKLIWVNMDSLCGRKSVGHDQPRSTLFSNNCKHVFAQHILSNMVNGRFYKWRKV